MTEELVARRCRVTGRVQGVYYRASAAQRAAALGVAGHARNLPDGNVEVLAYGPESAVEALIAWLWVGPSAARVTSVSVESIELAQGAVPSRFVSG